MLEMLFAISLRLKHILFFCWICREKEGLAWGCLVFLLTTKWRGYLSLLGQSQNEIVLLESLLKYSKLFWHYNKMQLEKISNKSKMYLAVGMTSMMITICSTFGDWIAWLIPYCYDSMLKVLSKELTLVLSDTRELDRVHSTK